MGKHVSSRGIKIHRQYTYEEAARILMVSVQTVRGWRRHGLVVLDGQKPHLIVGEVLKAFLDQRRARTKRRPTPDQFLCMRCAGWRRAYGGMADYTPFTPTRGVLTTLCEVCEGSCNKFASKAQLANLAGILTIGLRNAS